MKILIIGPSPSKSKGGMATVIQEIENDKNLKNKFDIDIYESYIDGHKLKVILFSIYAFLKFYFTKRNYDIYHIHMASYGSTFRKSFYVHAVKRWKKKVILHIHGAEYMRFFNKSIRKKKIISTLKSADIVIALSKDWKKKFDEAFGLKNCVVLENGIDTEKLESAVSNCENYCHTMVMLGRLGERKGTYDLIASIKQAKNIVPDLKCYLAGDGDIEKCRAIIENERLENNIDIVGWADISKKIELLKKSSILILPSYNEGLPMAILEGMASGKVVISTTVGAIPEVVEKENGILITPGDVKALTKAIIKCCTNIDYMKKASSKNIEKINNKYSMNYMHNKLSKYYMDLFDNNLSNCNEENI